MILGIGIDLLKVSRIKKILDKYGYTFLSKVFTENEIKRNSKLISKVNKFAKCYASKEAFVKALGTGFKEGVSYKDISLNNLNTGQPFLSLSRSIKEELKKKTPTGYKPVVNVSITDEMEYVIANVIISLEKK
jgi:holo-[acyl-carrier protein] synthase